MYPPEPDVRCCTGACTSYGYYSKDIYINSPDFKVVTPYISHVTRHSVTGICVCKEEMVII